MFIYTKTTCTPPISFWGYFLIQNSFFFLFFSVASTKKKVHAVKSFAPQNRSKLANWMGRNHYILE